MINDNLSVLLVNSSPNNKGCTYTALEQIQKTLKEENVVSEIYRIDNDIKGCVDCRKCSELGKCVFDDDVNSFVEKAEQYDGYIFAGPVYYGTINPTLTNFMTRVFFSSFFGGKRIFRLKPAAAVACARRAGTMTALDTVNRFFNWAEMPIISSTYWNVIYGANREEALEDKEGLRTIATLARNMAWFLRIKQHSLEEGIPLPVITK